MINLKLIQYATFSKQAIFETTEDMQVLDHSIPKGTQTDGATQPRWAVFLAIILLFTKFFLVGVIMIFIAYIFPAFGRYTLAAIVHDKLLDDGDIPRKEADKEMKKVLEYLNIKSLWSVLMYRLVRLNSVLFSWKLG